MAAAWRGRDLQEGPFGNRHLGHVDPDGPHDASEAADDRVIGRDHVNAGHAQPQAILEEKLRGVERIARVQVRRHGAVLIRNVHAAPGVHVDHSGKDDLPADVEHARVVRNLDVLSDGDDLAALDQHRALLERRAGNRNDPAARQGHLVRR